MPSDTATTDVTSSAVAEDDRALALTPALRAWLADAAATEERFARRTLYSWTSTATTTRMRRDRRLLDDNPAPEGPTPYVRWLEHVASKPRGTGRLAKTLLGHPDLRRRRYAWSRPWATRLGGGSRDYGDQLVAVVLRPDAIVARFDPGAMPVWRFQDLDHREVSLGSVLADPSRLAAVYHVRQGEPRCREYVITNESMVERWSIGTKAITELLAAEAAMVRQLGRVGADLDLDAPSGDDEELLASAAAFHVPGYWPTRANMNLLATRLETSRQRGEPLEMVPARHFDHDALPDLVAVRLVPPPLFPFDA